MLIVLLIISLIASPFLPGALVADQSKIPTAVVVVIDTSGSMRAKSQANNEFKVTLGEVAKLIEKLPAGSKVAVLNSQSPSRCIGFTPNCKKSAKAIREYQAGFGGLSVYSCLPRAAGMLRKSELSKKQLIIITDLTRNDWENSAPIDVDGCKVTIFKPKLEQQSNYSLELIETPNRSVFAGSAMPIAVNVASSQTAGEVTVNLYIDNELVDSKLVVVDEKTPACVRFIYHPKQAGNHVGRVAIGQPDSLLGDSQRYFNFEVESAAFITFLEDPKINQNDTAFIMKQAIMPNSRNSSFAVQSSTASPGQLLARDISDTKFIVLAGLPGLDQKQWEKLYDYVQSGGNLWIMPGDYTISDSYNTTQAQKIMPAKIGKREMFKAPAKLGYINYDDEYLKPFEISGSNPPLQDLRFYQRFGMTDLAPKVFVSAKFTDNIPAILTRPVGKGKVLFWNFSPVRTWSNLASLAGQLIVLSAQTKSVFLAPRKMHTRAKCGQSARIEIPNASRIDKISATSPSGEKLQFKISQDKKFIITDPLAEPGIYQIEIPHIVKSKLVRIAANMPVRESALEKIDEKALSGIFPNESLAIVEDLHQLNQRTQKIKISLNLLPACLIILIALMILENIFANKFYQKELNESEKSEQIGS